MLKDRKYHRGEKGLESKEIKYINSTRMQRLLDKLTNHFGFQFIKPEFRPVYINKRLKRWSGVFKGDKIDIADEHRSTQRDTLWHELLHTVVSDNYNKWYDENYKGRDLKENEWKKLKRMHREIEKAVFTLEGRGSHHTQNYKLSCDCGYWIKTVKRKASAWCRYCSVKLVSPKEYRKLKRMAELDSKVVEINIDNYKPWKDNKKIGVDIK